MIKASGSLQDLRSGLYGKRKTEWPWRHAKASDGRGGVVDGRSGHLDLGDGSRTVLESDSNRIGRINLAAKCAGARSAGNPHAACEVAGAGNGATELAKRARRGKPRTRPSERPDGPPRQFPTLPGWRLWAISETPRQWSHWSGPSKTVVVMQEKQLPGH